MVVPESSINNIMGGLESTGGVRLHNHKRKLKQRFDIVKKLGQGTYGKVQLGINKETGQEVAIKTIKKCKIETEADLIRIRREIQIMSSVHHPNIIHIYEVFENREKMVLVMEYAAGGELYDFLSERKVLAEEEARRIFRQISTAVYYCHKHQICHRDLKLENILLDENGNAKIADFGLSNVFDDSRLLGTFCGSPLYASPEIVKGTPYHGPEVDCWSLGVLLYTLVYGAMPFDGSNFKRLVRQISQGDYFEPKKPSPASPLIRDMLNINPARRADVTAICSHWWIDAEQSEPCLELAEQLANQTPVRLDLLLCLAPSADADKMLVADQAPIAEGSDRPLRSQSLSSLATAQPEFLPEPPQPKRDSESRRSKRKEEGGKRKERSRSRRERSSSRSRRDDSTPEPESSSEKPKRKSVKSKKSKEASVVEEPKEEELLQPKISEAEEDLGKSSETILAPQTPVDEVPRPKSPVPSDEVVIEELPQEEPSIPPPVAEPTKPPSPPPTPVKNEEPEKVVEKVEEKIPEEEKPTKPMERRKSKIFETAEKFNKISSAETQPKPPPKKVVIPGVKVSDAKKAYERRSSLASSTNFVRGSPSRKSLSGESSLSPVEDTKFSLASSVALNKLVENVERMSKLEDEKEEEKGVEKTEEVKTAMEQPKKPSPEKIIEVKREEVKDVAVPEEERKKVKNAVRVIGNAITEGIGGETKAATLPRRRTSRAEIKLAMPAPKAPEFRSEVEHMVGTPLSLTTQRAEVKFPVAAASPTPPPVSRPVVRQGSSPREFIVPIQVEQEPTQAPPTKPPPPPSAQRGITRTSSKSLSRQSTQDSDLSSTTSLGEPIRKSPREVIIPIAVEGGGYVTPSADTITRMSSLNESEDDLPRGFGLHSSRRQNRQLETADSVSSDEDDDNFEILTAENLFSTLLSRVRSLTQRLNTEDRQTAFPRLFNHHHSIFDIPPSRRLAEARSFGRADSVPWRRSMSRDNSHLPRGYGSATPSPSTKTLPLRSSGPECMSLQRMTNNCLDGSVSRAGAQRSGSLRSSGQEKPPLYRPNMVRSCSESLRSHPGTSFTNSIEQATINEQDVELTTSNETNQAESAQSEQNALRGIPTAEIVGSSTKKLTRSESKPEKRSSRLPQSSSKIIQETKKENAKNEVSGASSGLNVGSSQTLPRRNSLERPSYYNSLYKTGRYNGGMTSSLILPSGTSQNGDVPRETNSPTMKNFKPERLFSPPPADDKVSAENYSTLPKNFSKLNRFFSPPPRIGNSSSETVTSSPTESFSRLDRYLSPPPRFDNGDSSASQYDFHTIRPYSTLGRTLSYRSPSGMPASVIKTAEKAKMDNELEAKYSSSPTTNIGKGNIGKGGERLSSRLLRPQSLYGASDINYQTGSVADARAGVSLERKSAFVGRSPTYQRSVSLFEGKKADEYRRTSVTPDKSVLGKFLSEKKPENDLAKKDEIGDKSKTRKMSRFLRPDFYDTPKEDSVYEKKEKVKNSSNGDIWKEKDKMLGVHQKKSAKKSVQDDGKEKDNRLSIVGKAIKSLKENSLSKIEREPVMARESNLIKRAVSLEDVSLVPESRNKRASSLTPQTNYGRRLSIGNFEKTAPKKKTDDFKKNVNNKLNKNIVSSETSSQKQDSVIKKFVRKISPNNIIKKNNNEETSNCNGTKKKQTNEETNACNGTKFENNTIEDSGVSSRMSRIAGLKRLEFTRPLPSADSTPSMEESKVSGDLDDSSSFLSPTEDGSDTWSISSDYADARDFNTPVTAEDSVSDRIRRKSFYSRFNQSKRRKPSQSTPQSPLSPIGGSRSRLPMYSKSMTSDFTKMNHSKPTRKTSNPEAPTGK